MPILLALEALEADRRYVERQIAESKPSSWGTARAMWQSRLTDIEEHIAAIPTKRSSHASVALLFDGGPVVGSSDIRLDFTTDALDAYQKIVSLEHTQRISTLLPDRGSLRCARRSRLFIRDIVHGSMGFILEEVVPEQQEMFPTGLKDAVEGTTKLIGELHVSSDEGLKEALEKMPPRLVAAIQRFTSVLSQASANTRILGDEHKLVLSAESVTHLSARLREIQVTDELVSTDGKLLGILPGICEFELEMPGHDPAIIKGTVLEDIAIAYQTDESFRDRVLLKPVKAIIRNYRTIRLGRVVRMQRILEEIGPLPEM